MNYEYDESKAKMMFGIVHYFVSDGNEARFGKCYLSSVLSMMSIMSMMCCLCSI